jgi:flagellin
MLNRMRDLAVQAANTATNDSNARTAAQAEVTQLKAEIDRITGSTKFGQQALLDGTFGVTDAIKTGFNATGTYTIAASTDFDINVDGGGAVTVNLTAGTYTGAQLASHLQSAIRSAMTGGSTYTQAEADKVTVEATTVGAGFSLSIKAALASGDTFALTDGGNTPLADLALTGAVTAAAGSGGVFQVGANNGDTIAVSLASVSTAGLGIGSIDISADAAGAITLLDTAISTVSTTRGNLGAIQNRFESTIANLQVATENLSSSESRIRDTDMAAEMTNFTKQQILQQAGTAMLAQANSVPQSVLKLISG